jgi:hypothetical protein
MRPPIMRKALLVLATVLVYVLHQDVWFWRTARPLVFGFLPIGLFYHALFSVVAAGLMALLVKFAWPGHLERQAERDTKDQP